MLRYTSLALCLVLYLEGCGHDHDTNGDHDAHSEREHQRAGDYAETGSCEGSSGACFMLGWEGESTSAKLTVVDADPEDPARGMNSWLISLSDSAGAPLTECDVSLTPYMPEHAHGVATAPVISEGEPGQYQVEQIEFIMPGLWEMRVELVCEGWEASEKITYGIWLEA